MNIDEVKEGRKCASSIFTKFCLDKKKNKGALFCFYEGEDSKYYGRRVEEYTNRSCKGILQYQCGGKKSVLKVNELIKNKEEYSEVKTAYFVDRDFFPTENLEKNIYQTSVYSIENYYTSLTAFERILSYGFGINCSSEDFKKCRQDYALRMNEFHNEVLTLNAWIKVHRKKENDAGRRELKLNNLNITKYFKIGISKIVVEKKIDKKMLDGCFKELCLISDDEVSKIIEELKQTDMQKELRGKYEFEFLKKIIDDLKNKNKKGEYFNERYSLKLDPNVDSLANLSIYADIPDELKEFLKQFKL